MSIIVCALILFSQPNDVFLPQWMTPEESLRVDEIGKGHVVTAPPNCWVVTPGEFEPLRGVFVTWRYGTYNSIFREIVREVVEVSKAFIIARSSSEQSSITSYLNSGGVPLDSVEFYIYDNNSIWMRDYGPWFMRKQDDNEGITDFQYNRPRPQDDTIPWRIGQTWGIPVYGSPLEHPGGNYMVDGLGVGFASTLIYQENAGYSASEIDSLMYEYSGLDTLVVMQRINIEYTGHIDLWTKSLNDTLVMVGEYEPGHSNYTLLNQHADSIERCKNGEGFNFRVVRMPMPWSTSDAPPSYLNSLFVNNKILVPLWSEPEDDTALFIYEQVLPGYDVVGIDCSAMSGSGGAIHCITMQIPSDRFIHIRHARLPDTNDTLNPYRARARITTSSNLQTDSTRVFYRVNNGSYTSVLLSAVVDTPGVYAGYIPAQSGGDTVEYYLLAKNTESIRRTSPMHVPPQIYRFVVTGNPGTSEQQSHSPVRVVCTSANPTSTALLFAIDLSEQADVRIEVFNALGQKVGTLVNDRYATGMHTVTWRFRDNTGKVLPNGAYFYRVSTGSCVQTGKVLYIR
jgi:agmatine deiminase